MQIGISGAKGSFSHEAARHFCQKQDINKPELSFLVSADNVLKGLGVLEGSIQDLKFNFTTFLAVKER